MLKKIVVIILCLFSIQIVFAKNNADYYNSADLSDYFGTKQACTNDGSEDDCRNGNEYKFYLKLYDMYYLYKNKYNVKLDLPLIVSALYYGDEQLPTVYKNNLNSYNRDDLKDKNKVTNLDWEYDFKGSSCYKYLNANDSSYDMQILAKNMVTKKITYECSGSDGTSSSDSSSEVITNNSETGDGWSSVTTVKYDNGSSRTFRNYKQYKNGNSYWNKSYWDGNIASDGCGPTSVAIILSGYGYNYNPGNVVDTMHKNSITITSRDNLVTTLKKFKINAEAHSCTNTKDTINAIRNNFKAGRPIMIGTHNHWVAYLGEDKNGMIISDPGRSDGDHYRYGKTLEDLVSTASDGSYILIKSDGNASSTSDSSTKTSNKESSSSTKKNNKNIAEDKIFYIGDSWFEGLKSYAKSSKSYFYAKTSKNADWVLNNYSSAGSDAYEGKSLKSSIPKDTSAIVIHFGLNGTSMWDTTQKLVDKLVNDYSGKTIYVLQTPHVSKEYSSGSLTGDGLNANVDKYNSKMKSYCSSKKNVEFINPTKNIVGENGKGYLKSSYSSGTFHLNSDGNKQWYTDIIKGIKGDNSTTDNSDDNSSSSSSSGDGKTAIDVETSNYEKQLKCDGGTLNKDSIKATYELDLKKYDDFLLEYIKYKYHTAGSDQKCDDEVSLASGDYSSDINFLTGNFSPIHYYNQGDYSEPYGSFGTIATHGCGPTSLAIVISSITGVDHDPVEITNYVCEHGGCTSGGTAWANITSTGEDYGLDVTNTSNRQEVIDALGKGDSLVIVIMCAGHFTSGGHFIVLTGVTSEGKVTVADPASRDRSTEWDFDTVAGESCGGGNYWIMKKGS